MSEENIRKTSKKKNYGFFLPSMNKSTTNSTISVHYYPEGDWGWIILFANVVVNCLTQGFRLSGGLFMNIIRKHFIATQMETAWLLAISVGAPLIFSPVTISICIRKSTRLLAVIGGLIIALGCLFTSFATEFHQLIFSYGIIFSIGISMVCDAPILMIGQYFNKRRKFVELFVVIGTGIGISIMAYILNTVIERFNFRLGLHLVSFILFATFFLGMLYRSASLYHPQRRAILHLKHQKNKIKQKKSIRVKKPWFSLKMFRSRTFRIICAAHSISSIGFYHPLLIMMTTEPISIEQVQELHIIFGIAWMVGCVLYSPIIVHTKFNAKQYMCQVSLFVCGICIPSLRVVRTQITYYIYISICGFFIGGYNYSLKTMVYEKIRSKGFANTWSYVQFFQGISMFVGILINSYLIAIEQEHLSTILSSICIIFGGLLMFLLRVKQSKITRIRHPLICQTSVASSCRCQSCGSSKTTGLATMSTYTTGVDEENLEIMESKQMTIRMADENSDEQEEEMKQEFEMK